MEHLEQRQYLDDIFAWTREVKQLLSNHEQQEPFTQDHPLHEKLSVFEKKIKTMKSDKDSRDSLWTLYTEADELYRQCNFLITELSEKNFQDFRKKAAQASRVPIGEHKLPPLPYLYNALEPYIDEEIMRLHHSEHHRSYVEGLNKAEKEMEKARKKGDFELIKHWEREAAFNGAGHYLHTLFWNVMSPKGGGTPKGALKEQIELDFGGFEPFKLHFSEAAKKVEGGGWAILVWSPRARRLEILQAEKHQNLSQWDVIPILPLDVWEHAYYLQYKNNRKLYVDNWWNVVDWHKANERFLAARQLQWEPF